MDNTSRPKSQPRRENYPHIITETVRPRDLDSAIHVNNTIFAVFFEAGRISINRGQVARPKGMTWMLARVAIDYRAEIGWPGTVDIATGIERIGQTSITYSQALFNEGRCAATASGVSVLVDLTTRRPTPIPDDLREKLAPWMLAAASS